jgi:hypothetical protein
MCTAVICDSNVAFSMWLQVMDAQAHCTSGIGMHLEHPLCILSICGFFSMAVTLEPDTHIFQRSAVFH